jgi:hypothetical protein
LTNKFLGRDGPSSSSNNQTGRKLESSVFRPKFLEFLRDLIPENNPDIAEKIEVVRMQLLADNLSKICGHQCWATHSKFHQYAREKVTYPQRDNQILRPILVQLKIRKIQMAKKWTQKEY